MWSERATSFARCPRRVAASVALPTAAPFFFVAGTTIFGVIFIGLTIHSHTRFAELTNADAITPDVIAGKHVWHRKNCINCHTLLGEGAYYAPDLTKIAQHRGDAYLRQFLQDPSRYYSEERHGRLMQPAAFESNHARHRFPPLSHIDNKLAAPSDPRHGRISAGIVLGSAQPEAACRPVALGAALFSRSPPPFSVCHSLQENASSSAALAAWRRGPASSCEPRLQVLGPHAGDYIRESLWTRRLHRARAVVSLRGSTLDQPPLACPETEDTSISWSPIW